MAESLKKKIPRKAGYYLQMLNVDPIALGGLLAMIFNAWWWSRRK